MDVVKLLNSLYTFFDSILEKYDVYKVETIGDAYMAVCGLPDPCENHVEQMMTMAIRMIQIAREFSSDRGMNLRLRIGVNTGAVVAGIIGRRKFIYDLWGDTVNLASRMESHGVPDAIQVTRPVFEKMRNQYQFEERGQIEVKGKGAIETWILRA